MRFVTRIVATAVALAVAAWLLAGIRFTGPTHGSAEIQHKIVPLLLVALILAVVGAVVKPVVKVLSFPLIILTIGLFLLVINALMLMLTAWLAGQLGIGFHVHGFWTALVGSVIITLVTWGIDLVFDDDNDSSRRSRRSYR